MDGVFRRGGFWYARLIIPQRLREALGKTEFIATTGVREPALARVVAAELLAGWRRKLHDLGRLLDGDMDLEKIVIGNPALAGGGYLPLREAAAVSGLDESTLFEEAAQARLQLFYRAAAIPGHMLAESDLDVEIDEDGRTFIVPSPEQRAAMSDQKNYTGMLRVRSAALMASEFQVSGVIELFAFDVPERVGAIFVPAIRLNVSRADIQVLADEVEVLRKAWASRTTEAQLEMERSAKTARAQSPRVGLDKRTSQAVDDYMNIRSPQCKPDQARRIRGALDLFVELAGDPWLREVDVAALEAFRDKLALVPERENKIRLKYGTTSVSESIEAVHGLDWPTLSAREQVKRLKWIAGMFGWLTATDRLKRDPSLTLVRYSAASVSRAKGRSRPQDSRSLFTAADIHAIFSAGSWFATGRGELTANGTYREFLPHYYWLPLLALFTGARINELAQLFLRDIACTPAGTWYIDIASLDPGGLKSRKNAGSQRRVPIHPTLIDLGLTRWRERLLDNGQKRLFPELKRDKVKGYGKAPTKWFSAYLSRLGWKRDGTKVFHSFRSTLVSHCVNELRMTLQQTAQISGHARDKSILGKHYVKDLEPDELIATVRRFDFALPPVAPFDCDAGWKAVQDALARKSRGHGVTDADEIND